MVSAATRKIRRTGIHSNILDGVEPAARIQKAQVLESQLLGPVSAGNRLLAAETEAMAGWREFE
jgi:hypothetical protein